MEKNDIIKIICFVIAIGVIIGLFVYKSNGSKQREYAQAYQQSQSEQNYRQHVEEQKKANDAEYQVREAYNALVDLENSLGAELGSNDYKIKKKMAQKNLSHWIGVREEELNEELRQAEASGDAQKMERCKQDLDELNDTKKILHN